MGIDEIGQRLMLAFRGFQCPDGKPLDDLLAYCPAGFTFFRSFNIESPAQLRQLTADLSQAAQRNGLPPFLFALDQEGGQLMAAGNCTQLPGNMALGAANDPALAELAGQVLGRELSAMGINVDYAPCVDVNVNPRNPVVGVRSFGEDPQAVAALTAAMIRGIQSQGVAATAKHFPGHGDTATDSHLSMSLVSHSLTQLERIDLVPFQTAVENDVKLVMTGHLGLPALGLEKLIPATLAPEVLQGLLRQRCHFSGVVITDAMDMKAIQQGEELRHEVSRALQAGADLLLMTAEAADHRRAFQGLADAYAAIPHETFRASLQRIHDLKEWLQLQRLDTPLEVIRCQEHQQVARRIAEAALTKVRDRQQLLPLNPSEQVAVILPQPGDLTPADTSSYVHIQLAESLRQYMPSVAEKLISLDPDDSEITAALQFASHYDTVVIGTINAASNSGQARLVRELQVRHPRLIVAALRLPYDLSAFPEVGTYLCTYSILDPSMAALAAGLVGAIPFPGKLPVTLPGLVKTD